ncbi:methyltransferase domain-containing protein [Sphingomonas canadensis]|uniref:Methyltransferase domain-containing protein n=1 Tax=Sphingomonas canadensis TaxID=1219257 RepID=A0ABW3HAY2_9SPHN|nr:class I SAM-dependent methyltransferase [Sphingomonas canadensis]MCW3837994.1 class I SAM-dependent methyltransferase [Sphingomonas canadensis]
MDKAIVDYYDRLAPEYDSDRFAGTYGRFVDEQERAILGATRGLSGAVLDVGCGTGRLTGFATHGCDASAESVRIATAKHPGKQFEVADATAALPFADASFDGATCFHVLMHLDGPSVAGLLAQVARVLKPGGVFVVDCASATRRGLGRRRADGWHGSTSLTQGEFAALGRAAGLELERMDGTLMLPIHRLPAALRMPLRPLDSLACALAPDLASYLVATFRRAG